MARSRRYYILASMRVGLSVPQVATTFSCLVFMTALNLAMLRGAKLVGPSNEAG